MSREATIGTLSGDVARAHRLLAPLAALAAGVVAVPAAVAAAPVHVEVALKPHARVADVVRLARSLRSGPIRQIGPLHVLVVPTRRPGRLVARLRGAPGVASAAPAAVLRPALDTETDVDPGTGLPYTWAYDAVNAGPALAAVGGGSSFPVAVIDTGVDLGEPDLAGRISALRFDATGKGDDEDVTDIVGHGTMVAGIISMVDGNGIGGKGIAGATQVVPIRVTTSGVFFSDAVARAIVWATDHGIRIVNLSLGGHDLISPALSRALSYAEAHDVLLVAAAGNDGARGDAISYPAANVGGTRGGWSPGISVAATKPDGTAASFSTYNSSVTVAAPGAGAAACPGGIFSTLPSEGQRTFADDPANCDSLFGAADSPVTGRYAYAQGTSFSAPIVSAVAALVLQANPGLHAPQIADVIRRTAHQTVGTGWNQNTGAGVVDALAAVQLARTYDTAAPVVAFSAVRAGDAVHVTLTSADQTGPGETPAGAGPTTVQTSIDDKTWKTVATVTPGSPQATVPITPGARLWIRGSACDALHNCTTRDVGPFLGKPATPALRFVLQGYPGKTFRLRVGLGALQNAATAQVRLAAFDGTGFRTFQTVKLRFGASMVAREKVPVTGPIRLRATLVAGSLWRTTTSSLVVNVR
jgi:subtilisin family serine protease